MEFQPDVATWIANDLLGTVHLKLVCQVSRDDSGLEVTIAAIKGNKIENVSKNRAYRMDYCKTSHSKCENELIFQLPET